MEPVVDQLSPSLSIWHRYDPSVKAELFSTCLRTASGIYLIDPIPLPLAALRDILGDENVAGIIVTNGNHARAALDLAHQLAAAIFAHPEATADLAGGAPISLREGSLPGSQITAVNLEGAAPGEIALHDAADGGTLILGDALINMGSLGFTFLPAKYCSNAKQMRRSLRKLLDYSFDRMLFAHGIPIVTRARDRLETLLNEAS